MSFKRLLGEEYELALKYLFEAVGFYGSQPEDYILQTDTFHQILVTAILDKSGDNKISKYELGSMLGRLQNNMNGSCHALIKCHKLRGYSSKAHAYNKDERMENKQTKSWWFNTAKSLRAELSISYKYLVDYISKMP